MGTALGAVTLGTGAISALEIAEALYVSDTGAKVVVHTVFDAVMTAVEEQALKAKKKGSERKASVARSRSVSLSSTATTAVSTRARKSSVSSAASAAAAATTFVWVVEVEAKDQAKRLVEEVADDDETVFGSARSSSESFRSTKSYLSIKKAKRKSFRVAVDLVSLAKQCHTPKVSLHWPATLVEIKAKS